MDRHLILVRHSIPEIRKDLPAREWPLSEEGRRIAEKLADRLIEDQTAMIFTSPEPKAKETAEILAGRGRLPIQVVTELHEHERSSVPYLSKQEFEAKVREFFEKRDMLILGSETANQAHERFSRAISSILSDSGNSKIGVVTHGTVISLFVSRLTGQAGYPFWSQLGLPSLIELDLQSRALIALENIS